MFTLELKIFCRDIVLPRKDKSLATKRYKFSQEKIKAFAYSIKVWPMKK
jgi:hypothetical protein